MIARLKSIIKPVKPLETPFAGKYLQVFSHPRSGTHFLEAFIAQNFYSSTDLSIPTITWGHWANRRVNENGNDYGKLFGTHCYPERKYQFIDYPVVYIARDGRAVAYSIWKTDNFVHPEKKGLSFSEFLRTKLDWIGSPAFRSRPKFNIAQHWCRHVMGWEKLALKNPNIYFLKYEQLIKEPYKVYEDLRDLFFPNQEKLSLSRLSIIKEPTGLLPNKATADSWKDAFSFEDEKYFRSCIKCHKYLIE